MRDENDYERRKQQRLRKLGSPNPKCAICGYEHWQGLELHHVEGQAFGETLIVVCRNCHRRLSDAQRDHSQLQARGERDLTRFARLLGGFADLLELVVEKLREIATEIVGPAQTRAEA